MPRWKPTRSRNTPSSQGGECHQQGQGGATPTLERGGWAQTEPVLPLPEPQCPNPEPSGALEMEFCCFPIQSHPLLAKLSKSRQLGLSPPLSAVSPAGFFGSCCHHRHCGQGEQGAGCWMHPLPAVPPNGRRGAVHPLGAWGFLEDKFKPCCEDVSLIRC